MISKKVSMKTPEKSRFGKLVSYLVNDQGKHTRVGEVTITNCVSTDLPLAVREIAATQQLNTRAQSDRTYHLLISLRAGEHPDAQTLEAIEERFCAELGYSEHQRISVVHRDRTTSTFTSRSIKSTRRILLSTTLKPIIGSAQSFALFLSTSWAWHGIGTTQRKGTAGATTWKQ